MINQVHNLAPDQNLSCGVKRVVNLSYPAWSIKRKQWVMRRLTLDLLLQVNFILCGGSQLQSHFENDVSVFILSPDIPESIGSKIHGDYSKENGFYRHRVNTEGNGSIFYIEIWDFFESKFFIYRFFDYLIPQLYFFWENAKISVVGENEKWAEKLLALEHQRNGRDWASFQLAPSQFSCSWFWR